MAAKRAGTGSGRQRLSPTLVVISSFIAAAIVYQVHNAPRLGNVHLSERLSHLPNMPGHDAWDALYHYHPPGVVPGGSQQGELPAGLRDDHPHAGARADDDDAAKLRQENARLQAQLEQQRAELHAKDAALQEARAKAEPAAGPVAARAAGGLLAGAAMAVVGGKAEDLPRADGGQAADPQGSVRAAHSPRSSRHSPHSARKANLQHVLQNHKHLLEGLEPYIFMTEANRTSVFATAENFFYTHAGPRLSARAYNSKSARGLPEEDEPLLSPTGAPDRRHKSCAIVGNGVQLLSASYGKEIDRHEAVMRINQGPFLGFEPYVGSKTHYRLINHKWADAYTTNPYLQLEKNATLVVSRTGWQEFLTCARKMKKHRPDVTMRLLTRESADAAGNMLRFMRKRLEQLLGVRYPGKASPSSGWVGLHFMLQSCDTVTTYGIGNGPQPNNPGQVNWHYFENRHFKYSREFGRDPHHSFDLEHDSLELLQAGGILRHVKISRGDPLRERAIIKQVKIHPAMITERLLRTPRDLEPYTPVDSPRE
eukprot:jgi/Tetstr1/436918/TSEL_025691.t1